MMDLSEYGLEDLQKNAKTVVGAAGDYIAEAQRVAREAKADAVNAGAGIFTPKEKEPEDSYDRMGALNKVFGALNPFSLQGMKRQMHYLRNPGEIVDFGAEMLNSGTIGLSDRAIAELDATFTGKDRAEALANSAARRDERRENLGGVESLMAQAAGSVVGAPKYVGLAADAVTRGGAGVRGFVSRLGTQGVVAGAEASAEDLISGQKKSGLEWAKDFGLYSGAGMLAQGAAGELTPTAIKWLGGYLPYSRVGAALVDKGSDTSPMAAANLVEQAQGLRGTDQGVLNLGEGEYAGAVGGRLAQYVPTVNYPATGKDAPVLGARQGDIMGTDNLAEHLTDQADGINAAIKADLGQVLDHRVTEYENFKATQDKLADGPRKAYDAMFRDPTKVYHYENNILPDLRKRFAGEYDMSSTRKGGAHSDVWNEVTGELQPKKQLANGKDVVVPLYNERTGERQDLGSIGLEQLKAARQKAANLSKPGAMISGTPIDRTKANAAKSMVKMIDGMIDDRTGGAYLGAKLNYAEIMAQDEAYDYGMEAFGNMGGWTDEVGKNFKEYWSDLSDEGKEQFRAGFTNRLDQHMKHTSTPYNTVIDLFGDITAGPKGAVLSTKKGNEEVMKLIYGDEVTERLKKVAVHWKPMQDSIDDLATQINRKRASPTATAGEVTDMSETYGVHALNPRGTIDMFSPTGTSSLGALIRQPGVKEAGVISKLATAKGDEAADLMEDIMKAYAVPEQVGTGSFTGALLGGGDSGDYYGEEGEAGLFDFLK